MLGLLSHISSFETGVAHVSPKAINKVMETVRVLKKKARNLCKSRSEAESEPAFAHFFTVKWRGVFC